MSSNDFSSPGIATALTATLLGLHSTRYASCVHKTATSGSILTIPASNLANYSTVAITAMFVAREVSSGHSASFYRYATFKNENGTLVQIGSTRTIVTDNDSGAVSTDGASVSVSLVSNSMVFTVNSGTGSMDWSIFADVMIYGISQ